jgi:hypothetical protein
MTIRTNAGEADFDDAPNLYYFNSSVAMISRAHAHDDLYLEDVIGYQ